MNSNRWLNLPSHESMLSILSGDSLPGGDTCDADGCTRRGPDQMVSEDISGVEKVNI